MPKSEGNPKSEIRSPKSPGAERAGNGGAPRDRSADIPVRGDVSVGGSAGLQASYRASLEGLVCLATERSPQRRDAESAEFTQRRPTSASLRVLRVAALNRATAGSENLRAEGCLGLRWQSAAATPLSAMHRPLRKRRGAAPPAAVQNGAGSPGLGQASRRVRVPSRNDAVGARLSQPQPRSQADGAGFCRRVRTPRLMVVSTRQRSRLVPDSPRLRLRQPRSLTAWLRLSGQECPRSSRLRPSDFGFLSDFGFRISDF